MRRITIKYAQPGMILGMPVYDNYAKEILGRRTRLNDECLDIMAKYRVSEIIIDDPRVDDVVVAAMVSPEKEGKLADAFRQLLNRTRSTQIIDSANISQVNIAVTEVARNLSLGILGEINVTGSVSLVDYTFLHPVKSAILSMALGYRLGMSIEELTILGMGSLLKDISYVYLPPVIMNKSSLTEQEVKIVQERPAMSYNILTQFPEIKEAVANVVLQHHEQWNGHGYPRGLQGPQISTYAQIISAADVFSDLLVEHPGKGVCHTKRSSILWPVAEIFSILIW